MTAIMIILIIATYILGVSTGILAAYGWMKDKEGYDD